MYSIFLFSLATIMEVIRPSQTENAVPSERMAGNASSSNNSTSHIQHGILQVCFIFCK